MKLIFVQDTKSDFLSNIEYALKGFFSPERIPCNLTKLSTNGIKLKDKWKSYLESLGFEVIIIDKDKFIKKHGREYIQYPAVFKEKNGRLNIFINSLEISKCKDLDQLIELMDFKLNHQ